MGTKSRNQSRSKKQDISVNDINEKEREEPLSTNELT